MELPYRVEYAGSSRAACRKCKNTIEKNMLRLAVMGKSSMFDGRVPHWFHEKCFFTNHRPKSEGDIEFFENIRIDDQNKIQKIISENSNCQGKKRSGGSKNSLLNNFGIEYSKSSRAKCRSCDEKIQKGDIRVKKVVFDTEVGMKYGGQALWYHLGCFAQTRQELEWYDDAADLPGFSSISKEDQETIIQLLPAINPDTNIKKIKAEPNDVKDEEDKIEMDKIAKQNKTLFKFRDLIENNLKKSDIVTILEYNDQQPVRGTGQELLNQLADVLAFGALKECKKCNQCQFSFHKMGYKCNGDLSEWSKCENMVSNPERIDCKIPSDYRSILKGYKSKVQARIIKYVPPSTQVSIKKDDATERLIKKERALLYGLNFGVFGIEGDELRSLKNQILQLGGNFTESATKHLTAAISTAEFLKKMGKEMKTIKKLGIYVVPKEFMYKITDNIEIMEQIKNMTICDWGSDTHLKNFTEKSASKHKSAQDKSAQKSVRVTIKNGTAVDPDSGLSDVAHVYTENSIKYTAVLGLTDIQAQKNSYYKLQLLKGDTSNRFWVFRAWGRIGTTIGGNKVEDFRDLYAAKASFTKLYYEKSGNEWNTPEFKKFAGKLYPIDIDYGDDYDKLNKLSNNKLSSKLAKPVQELISLIFDVETMKRALLEFELDTEKMPLGRLSRKQIQQAYKVLGDISNLLQIETKSDFMAFTNRFYTLIPHNFGMNNPPLINSFDQIKVLTEKLDALLELECAYNLLKNDNDDKVNFIDQNYDKLKTDIVPLEENSEEFNFIKQYVINTHADTHKTYELEIVNIFTVTRKGELRRYKPFKKLNNRKLLWHGSRLTNFVGILSHGLKIAPPEAPSTGYMFGKGIYFADMVSKSANYCYTSKQNNGGLLLLSEVALGNMFECTKANYLEKLPGNYHSTKGIGETEPDPTQSIFRDGVEIPLGKPSKNSKIKSSLLYNEYIVYDIAQVNVRYLLRVNFHYKY